MLCGAGAVLGVVLAQPLVAMVSRYAARFSVRALEVTVDPGMLWIATGLAMAAAVLLARPTPPVVARACRPRPDERQRPITPGTNRRLRIFATTQIAFSFVLLAGAGMLLAALVSMQTAQTGYDMRQVLAFNIPASATGLGDAKAIAFYQEATRRISGLPGVEGVAVGSFVPWRDAGDLGPGFLFTVDGYTPADGEENPRGRMRMVAPRFFAVLGVPLVAGRDFTDDDRRGSEPVSIVSQSVAERLFPNGDAINRHLTWTDPVFSIWKPAPSRIVGVVADVDDENVVPGPAMTIYQPAWQVGVAGRLFVHAAGDPYARACSDARHPRDFRGPARGARRHARGRARGGAVAGAAERFRVLRICRHRVADRRRGCGGRAGVLGERTHARVRRAAGRRIVAAAPAGARPGGRIADRRHRHRCGGRGRLRICGRGGELSRQPAPAGPWPLVGAAVVLVSAAALASLMRSTRGSTSCRRFGRSRHDG